MSDALYVLHNEHAKFEGLLGLIEPQVAALQHGPTPDYELVLNGMQVVGQYLSYIHHPMERLVLERLLKRLGHARSLLEPFITQDWRYFDEHSTAFLGSLDAVLNGACVSREVLVSRGRDSMRICGVRFKSRNAQSFPWPSSCCENRTGLRSTHSLIY